MTFRPGLKIGCVWPTMSPGPAPRYWSGTWPAPAFIVSTLFARRPVRWAPSPKGLKTAWSWWMKPSVWVMKSVMKSAARPALTPRPSSDRIRGLKCANAIFASTGWPQAGNLPAWRLVPPGHWISDRLRNWRPGPGPPGKPLVSNIPPGLARPWRFVPKGPEKQAGAKDFDGP